MSNGSAHYLQLLILGLLSDLPGLVLHVVIRGGHKTWGRAVRSSAHRRTLKASESRMTDHDFGTIARENRAVDPEER
eukprot:3307597-Rhodomonas_salina.1